MKEIASAYQYNILVLLIGYGFGEWRGVAYAAIAILTTLFILHMTSD